MAFYCTAYRPRQVILVALLTSAFWFALNTVLLVKYSNIGVNKAKTHKQLGEEDRNYDFEFERQLGERSRKSELFRRGISKFVGEQGELDTINGQKTIDDANLKGYQSHTEELESRLIGSNRRSSQEKELLIKKSTGQEIQQKKRRLVRNKHISSIQAPAAVVSDLSVKIGEREIANTAEDKTPDPNGPGEHGMAVFVPAKGKRKENGGYKKYAFNEYVSNMISLERSIPDTRSPG